MKNLVLLVFVLAPSFLFAQSAFDRMSNTKMEKIIIRESSKMEGQLGNWQIVYREKPLFIITDENANRMRIMTPITEDKEVSDEVKDKLLEANFDRALDAKYAIYKGYVWSVFTHPLGELTVEQFKDAMTQVVKLAENYGGTYTSTDFVFGGATTEEEKDN